jgi:hypothetical protein
VHHGTLKRVIVEFEYLHVCITSHCNYENDVSVQGRRKRSCVWCGFVLPCPLRMRQFPWFCCTSLSPTELLHFASRVSPGFSIVAAAACKLLADGKTKRCDQSIAFCMLAWLHNCLIFAAPPPAMSLQSFIHRHGCASPNGLAHAQTEPARISPTYITPLTTLPPPQPLNHHTHPPLSQPRFPQWTVHNRKRNKKIQKTHSKKPVRRPPTTTLVTYCRLLPDSPATSPHPASAFACRVRLRARQCVV